MKPEGKWLSWQELSEGMTTVVPFSISAADMETFAALSGDHSDLHVNRDFARAKGFEDVLVYGGLLAAKASNLIGMHLPGLNSLETRISLDFRKPLYVGQAAEIEGTITSMSEATRLISLKIVIRSGGKVLARGESEILHVESLGKN